MMREFRGPDRLYALERSESDAEGAIEFGLLRDGRRQLVLHDGALAAVETEAALLGPQRVGEG